ncbi:MAG: bifunctional methylenetetrahydrofolate dehydrogenase/methenyltetrahydrofolate cyclohydrolase FolD [Bacteroidales bacterium]|nr:bifunctional methylenetetrahydrofolate dehydrogenase/methenyltetrahydrofolate cyclohydrolase FolD [Bacteroidales bacterium]
MKLIDGKLISEQIKKEIATEVAQLIDNAPRGPHLAAIIVGSDPASMTYVAAKERACKSVGITSSVYNLAEQTTEKELMQLIDFLNEDSEVDGFIVQLPLPTHLDEQKVINAIKPEKDVDGFHPINLGKMVLGIDTMVSATPNGILELLSRYKIETAGKHCVVIGRSNIVGTPVSILLSRKGYPGNATVTLCHSQTPKLADYTLAADILIVAIGKPEFVDESMVKPGAVIIDVGIHRIDDSAKSSGYRLVGDVDFNSVSKKASYISPVPGGVGPMTIAALLMNTLKAYKKTQIN